MLARHARAMQTEEQVDLGVGQTAELANLAASATETDQLDGLDIETLVDVAQTQLALLIGEPIERAPDAGLMLTLIDDILSHGLDGAMQSQYRGIQTSLILSQRANKRLQVAQPCPGAHGQQHGQQSDEQRQHRDPERIDRDGVDQTVHRRASGIVVDETLALTFRWRRAARLSRWLVISILSTRTPILHPPIGQPSIVLAPIGLTALAKAPISTRTIGLTSILRAALSGPPLLESALSESTLSTTPLVTLATATAIGPATQQPGALLFQSAFLVVSQRPRRRLGLNRSQVSDTLAHGFAPLKQNGSMRPLLDPSAGGAET